MSNFPSQAPPNQYNAITGETYKFQSATLEADHPPINDSSNKVATTGWIQSLISGIPMWPTTSDATGGTGLLITVSDGVVNNLSGGACNISASVAPIAVNANSQEYVYVRFSDCQIVVSTTLPNPSIGYVISLVTTNANKIISIINYSSINSFASTISPIFTGNPQAPTPPLGDCDNSIATTEFVCQAIQEFTSSSPTFTGDPKAPTAPPGDCDNSIATTEFVCQAISNLTNQISYPQIIDKGGLNINVTAGEVPKPGGSMCNITPLPSDLGINPSTIEYIYVRYSDCRVVASTSQPLNTVGFILGTIATNATSITQISQHAPTLQSSLLSKFKVGFGGNLIMI
jgi:hypothetical protein